MWPLGYKLWLWYNSTLIIPTKHGKSNFILIIWVERPLTVLYETCHFFVISSQHQLLRENARIIELFRKICKFIHFLWTGRISCLNQFWKDKWRRKSFKLVNQNHDKANIYENRWSLSIFLIGIWLISAKQNNQ